jgi:thiamine pyrophosphokinase
MYHMYMLVLVKLYFRVILLGMGGGKEDHFLFHVQQFMPR